MSLVVPNQPSFSLGSAGVDADSSMAKTLGMSFKVD
jgi:hypothetical protein